jgi:hypothetical protein
MVKGAILIALFLLPIQTAAHSQSLDSQEKCASQAQKVFGEYQLEDRQVRFGSGLAITSDYRSHYNTKLQRCFVVVEATHVLNGQISTSVTLTDAYERRGYGDYIWMSKEEKKYWEVPPVLCELDPISQEKRFCNGREEFDAFVAEYMEQ